MAVIPPSTMQGSGFRTANFTNLSASDTFSGYNVGSGALLLIFNPTGGTLALTLIGDGAVAFFPEELGTLVGGPGFPLSISVPSGGSVVVALDEVYRFLADTPLDNNTITGGTGMRAALLMD